MSGRLKFILPSAIGAILFLLPLRIGGKITVGFAAISQAAIDVLAAQMPAIAAGLVTFSALFSLYATLVRPRFLARHSGLRALFEVRPGWLLTRLLGAFFANATLFQLGPVWLYGAATGGVILNDLAAIIVGFFLVASLLLPFLTAFGLMEFFGALASRVFRRVFTLPGRSSIDAVASWMGSGPVGVLITIQQYNSGYYSQREAAVIATNFSVVSIAFCVVIINFVGLGHLFVPFYLTVVLAGLIAAVITPRLPPLSGKRDLYFAATGKRIAEEVPPDRSMLSWGFAQAVARAEAAPPPAALFKEAMANVFDIWFGLLPAVFAIGTTALIIVDQTPVFDYLAYPFAVILDALAIPEATAAAPAFLIGFADQFLPAILGKSLESDMTRFVVACISVTQLIYMSEIGTLLLRSHIPLGLIDLFAIFILRTLITLPVIAAAAHLIF